MKKLRILWTTCGAQAATDRAELFNGSVAANSASRGFSGTTRCYRFSRVGAGRPRSRRPGWPWSGLPPSVRLGQWCAALVQDYLPESLALLRLDPAPSKGGIRPLEVFALVERAYVRREGMSAFISYRREGGSETARLISADLQGRGVKTFLDLDDLGAHHFDERLYHEIEAATNFILVLSPNCLDRCVEEEDWLRREIRHAIRTDRNIVPILKDGFSFRELRQLPVDLADLPRYNCVRYSHEYFGATMDRVPGFLIRTRAQPVPVADSIQERPGQRGTVGAED